MCGEPVDLCESDDMKTKHLNKVRDMAGVRPGFGSAGRANGSNVEKRQASEIPDSSAQFTGFGDVGRACHVWLMKHDPVYRQKREQIQRLETARQERRNQSEAGGDL